MPCSTLEDWRTRLMQTMKGRLMLLGLIAVIAGCTLPGSKTSPGGGSTQGAGASTEPGGAGVGGTVTLNKEFWHTGFHVTLGEVKYTPAPKVTPGAFALPGKVVIQARFENLGPETAGFNPTMSMAVGNNQYTDINPDQKLPNVPGKATGTGVIAFTVDNKFDLGKAVMTVGDASHNQAIVPFGTSGNLVTLAPIKVTMTGSVVLQGLYKLDVTGGDLSYDNPLNHQEEDAGNQLLVVHFSKTALVDTCCITAQQFSLKLPDGTAVAADRVEECCGIGTTGTTKADQYVTFVFKKGDGSYDMIAKEKVQGTDVQGDLAFTITNSAGGSASPGGSGGGTNPTPSSH
jgi:hypothetical protein